MLAPSAVGCKPMLARAGVSPAPPRARPPRRCTRRPASCVPTPAVDYGRIGKVTNADVTESPDAAKICGDHEVDLNRCGGNFRELLSECSRIHAYTVSDGEAERQTVVVSHDVFSTYRSYGRGAMVIA